MLGKQPTYNDLRVFGCLCYLTIKRPQGDKFAPRAIKGVFVGYSSGKKGYKVYDLATDSILVSRDVFFQEEMFPFKVNHSGSLSIDENLPMPIVPTILGKDVHDVSSPSILSCDSMTSAPYFTESGSATIDEVG